MDNDFFFTGDCWDEFLQEPEPPEIFGADLKRFFPVLHGFRQTLESRKGSRLTGVGANKV
jgi:hypothetical protein